MGPHRKPVKAQASRKSRSESNTHSIRKRKLKRSSLDYASPTDEKDYRPGHGQSRALKKPKKVIVPRSAKGNENLRDPFDVLDDDAVFLIIDQLSARDTETLRRVSKLWKASSEAHCGRNALLKHFPQAAAKLEGHGSREEENLRFRRHLHYRESLAIGYATRAIICTGAMDWHLEHDTLVWSNTKGDFSIRTLRSRSDDTPIASPATSIDFRSFKIPFTSIDSIQLTEDGHMIVDLQGQTLMKITKQGTVLWEIDFASLMSRPAVGRSAVFLVERPTISVTPELGIAFVKVSLEDGSISYRNQLSGLHGRAQANESDKHLRLFSDEGYAIWRNKWNSAYVFSTKTGQMLQEYSRTTRLAPVVSRQSSSIWDIHPKLNDPPWNIYHWPDLTASFSQRVTCQEETPALKFEGIKYPDHMRSRYYHTDWRFSGDHLAFFYFTHVVLTTADFDRRFLGQHETTDPYTNVWVSVMARVPSAQANAFEIKEKDSAFPISLPSRSETLGERRSLEVDLPRKMKDNDYLSMMNDYMVYHSPDQELLLLVDFWPNW